MREQSSPSLTNDVLFLAGCALVMLIDFSLLRGILLYRNYGLSLDIPTVDLVRAMGVGLRFDLMVVCYTLIPLTFSLLLPNGLGTRRLALMWLSSIGFIINFIGVVELDFYHEFHARLNGIAIQYLKEDPATVGSMLWHGFPVLSYFLLVIFIWGLFVVILRMLDRQTKKEERLTTSNRYMRLLVRVFLFFGVLVVVLIGSRGTLRQGPPLRWGDAFHSQHLFANHLAYNGTISLFKAAAAASHQKNGRKWLKKMPQERALKETRELILTPQDELIKGDKFPLLRRHTPINRLPSGQIKNVVLIIMESFSGQFVGALGNEHGVTPAFDKLAKEGLLFERFFSNGTHTHQGMFASGACFPNLPGFEYLMQQPQGGHAFSGLPVLMAASGLKENRYVYNGDFAWDNQEGFFRNQGMTGFVGRNEYVNPVVDDPTWGVADEDMFNRALLELDDMAKKGPFYGLLQTLSNHTPYALPSPLPMEAITGFGEFDMHLTAMRYSDWALGEFFEEAKKSAYYSETLFIVVGDHGFVVKPLLGDIDLLRFHVPMLLIGPGVQEAYGERNNTVGSQVDIVPTLTGLLGKPFIHQCWGRNLLSLPESDQGVAMIKPSGGDQTVALIKGDKLLVHAPNQSPNLGEYQLKPEKRYTRLDNAPLLEKMDRELVSYLGTALRALLENRTGRGD
jgi:phosphoglycerol transferase MdoB-like AlkP superfamily enzyme